MAEMQWQIKVVIRNFYSEILKGKRCLDQCGVGICFFFNNTLLPWCQSDTSYIIHKFFEFLNNYYMVLSKIWKL